MVNNKIAFLIDGAFFFQRYKNKHGINPTIKDMDNFIKEQLVLIQEKTGSDSKDILFRILYYDCLPFDKEIKIPNTNTIYPTNKNFINYKNRFINQLKKKDFVALRLGILSLNGWKKESFSGKDIPDFKQKGVDMKIGLDMAWMASKKTVDKIALVTGDSDFISPMKLVRREGILVYLITMGHNVKSELCEHADFIIKCNTYADNKIINKDLTNIKEPK